mmetsp:Transcript_24056/g.69577  ORF Transcript_24056/g.69577 Transcript_24056/m.69577 type:complete len:228 (+) Transcript_24056:787-1470(+)
MTGWATGFKLPVASRSYFAGQICTLKVALPSPRYRSVYFPLRHSCFVTDTSPSKSSALIVSWSQTSNFNTFSFFHSTVMGPQSHTGLGLLSITAVRANSFAFFVCPNFMMQYGSLCPTKSASGKLFAWMILTNEITFRIVSSSCRAKRWRASSCCDTCLRGFVFLTKGQTWMSPVIRPTGSSSFLLRGMCRPATSPTEGIFLSIDPTNFSTPSLTEKTWNLTSKGSL